MEDPSNTEGPNAVVSEKEGSSQEDDPSLVEGALGRGAPFTSSENASTPAHGVWAFTVWLLQPGTTAAVLLGLASFFFPLVAQ